MKLFIFILIIAFVVIFILWRFRRNFKFLNPPSFCLVTGGVKTGKTKCGVYLSTKDFKRKHRKWFFMKVLYKFFRKKYDVEEPMFYTNGTVSFGNWKNKKKHRLDRCIRKLTTESLLRIERFNYKSVIFIQECSLLCDNMDFNNLDRNVELSLWAKLIAHETRGGSVYADTQSILDLHYSFKRVCSSFYFVQKRLDFFFFDVLFVREMINTELGANNFIDDVDTSVRKVFIPRWYNHRYDRYEFSYLTDDLKVSKQPFKRKDSLVSFNPRYREHADKRVKEENK